MGSLQLIHERHGNRRLLRLWGRFEPSSIPLVEGALRRGPAARTVLDLSLVRGLDAVALAWLAARLAELPGLRLRGASVEQVRLLRYLGAAIDDSCVAERA